MALIDVAVPFTGRWYFEELLRGVEREAAAAGKPVVAVGGAVEGLASIGIDEHAAAVIATRHLLDLGHRRVAHLAGRIVRQHEHFVNAGRIAGYTDAMRAAGFEGLTEVVRCSLEAGQVYGATRRMLSRDADRPTAIFAASDQVAFSVIEAAQNLGLRVPEDVSVVGIDDHPSAAGAGLTTVRQEPARLGADAAALVLASQRTLPGTTFRVVPTPLVVRSTTAPPHVAPSPRSWVRSLLRPASKG